MILDVWAVLVGCSTAEVSPTLQVTHPDPLTVEVLGPVVLRNVRLDNGAQPHGLDCSVDRGEVARVRKGRVVAVGPGVTEVSCAWEEQQVQFMLDVQLATVLSFDQVPDGLRVGESVRLAVHALQGDEPVPLGPARWETSDAEVLEVAAGHMIGRSPGVAFVTVRARGATAQVEISVEP